MFFASWLESGHEILFPRALHSLAMHVLCAHLNEALMYMCAGLLSLWSWVSLLNKILKRPLQQADSAQTGGLELADLFQLSSDRTGVLSASPTQSETLLSGMLSAVLGWGESVCVCVCVDFFWSSAISSEVISHSCSRKHWSNCFILLNHCVTASIDTFPLSFPRIGYNHNWPASNIVLYWASDEVISAGMLESLTSCD